jgi:hypothetical protein
MRLRSRGLTRPVSLPVKTSDTVDAEQPARAATSRAVARRLAG